MAFFAELLEELVGMPDNLATDLAVVKQHRAEAIVPPPRAGSSSPLFHRSRRNLQHRLPYGAEAVETLISHPFYSFLPEFSGRGNWCQSRGSNRLFQA